MFSIRGLRLYFPELKPWVARSVLIPRCSSWFIYVQMWGCRVCWWSHCLPRLSHSLPCLWVWPCCPKFCLPRLHVSAPPTSLDECFFFISLVVRLLCGSIFCQFWLFFVFKLLLSFFWLCEEVQCVYLCLHLVWNQSALSLLRKKKSMGVEPQTHDVDTFCCLLLSYVLFLHLRAHNNIMFAEGVRSANPSYGDVVVRIRNCARDL